MKRKINKVSSKQKEKNSKVNMEIKNSKAWGNSHEMAPKKYYELIGDSLLNNIQENGFKTKEREVNIKRWQGGQSVDMVGIIKPLIRKKPDEIIVYVGCNDITNNRNLW